MQFSRLFVLQTLYKRWGEKNPMLEIGRVLLAVHFFDNIAVCTVSAHVPLHVGNVVKFGNIAVFLHIWTLVLRHGGD